MTSPSLVTVTAETVEKTGFFCKMSARGKPGYEQKLAWLKARFAEGLQMRLLGGGARGFVEFVPGAQAWRAIEGAEDCMVIHCLWVVGRSKGQGFSGLLLDEVGAQAAALGFKGVAAVTSSGNWLIDEGVLARRGYESVAKEAPGFDLMLRRFDADLLAPRFCGGWDDKLRAQGDGLTVFRSAQCPYLDDAVAHAREYAADSGRPFREVWLESAEDVRKLSPTPYGVFALALDGRLISYHYLLKKQIGAAVEKSGE